MRKKRILKLADKIEKHKSRFDMGVWFDDRDKLDEMGEKAVALLAEERKPLCGTTACLAGWAVFMFGTEKQIKQCLADDSSYSEVATGLLGLDDNTAYGLFYSNGSAKHMAGRLRELVKE